MTSTHKTASTAWAGEVHLGHDWLCFTGPLGSASPHAHHAMQIAVSCLPFTLQDGGGEVCETEVAVIPPDAMHALRGSGQIAWLLYLQKVPPTSPGNANNWAMNARGLEPPSALAHLDSWVANTSRQLGTVEEDPSGFVPAAMEEARAVLPHPVRLADIATVVGVAPTTLSRRFTQVIGIPWRRWILAERLLLSARSLAEGANLTVAAHRSGFSDSAHLTRTFRAMFGIAPSDLTSVVSWHVH